jgi:2-polyprenyl-3-methyl-5-hydroxy-6-metoxy-1,4-benzoquinol methylase
MPETLTKAQESISGEALAKFKEMQRQGWSHFAPLEMFTTPPAARLVNHAHVLPDHHVLDVGCGTGVVAVTAARLGAEVTGLDLTPELLERAHENSRISGMDVQWHQGDVEELPFEDESFDVVLSQFGHMFAPRPAVAVAQMLRVLKPGGTIAFSTWPPELYIGRMFAMVARYAPPPPAGVASPALWGDPNVIRERLGGAVRDIAFDAGRVCVPALSPQHIREFSEKTAGPVVKLVEALSTKDPTALARFRSEYESLAIEYIEDNQLRQDYLMTRATKI